MITFESYDRRINQILPVLKEHGLNSLEEAEEYVKSFGLDVYKMVKDIQPICFENACYAYLVGAAIALKKGSKTYFFELFLFTHFKNIEKYYKMVK